MRQQRFFVILAAVILGTLIYTSASIVSPMAQANPHHAFVIGSDPVDGSTIDTMPSVVRIFFNAPIGPASVAHIYAIQQGDLVDVGEHSSINPNNPRELDIPLKTPGTEPSGSYEVKWVAVANDDGHTTYGLIGFNLGFSGTGISGTPTLGPSTSNKLDGEGGVRTLDIPGGLAVAWDWLTLLALTMWIGILVIEHLILPVSGRTLTLLERARKRTVSLQGMCLYALLFGEIVALVLRINRQSRILQVGSFDPQVLLQLLTETTYGWLWLVRMALLILALSLFYLVSRKVERPAKEERPPLAEASQRSLTHTDTPAPRITIDLRPTNTGSQPKEPVPQKKTATVPAPIYTLIWVLLAMAMLLTYALTDGRTQVLQPHISVITFSWLNLAAQGIWFGGIAYLGVILLPLLPSVTLDHHEEPLALLLQRMSPLLLIGIGVALVSNFFLGEASITDIQQLTTDAYGRTLLVQAGITMLLLLLSLYMWLRLCPRLTRQALLLPVVDADKPARRVRRSVIGQTEQRLKAWANVHTWLAAGVLLCAALMAFFAPPIVFPNITYSNPSTANNGSAQTKQMGDLSVTLQVAPGNSNSANAVIISITDNNGNPVSNAEVQLSTDMQVMNMGTAYATVKNGNPLYIATFAKGKAFSMAGLWMIDVNIQRPDHTPVQDTFRVMLTQ